MSFEHEINSGDFAGDVGYVQRIMTFDAYNGLPITPPIPIALDNGLGEFPSDRQKPISPNLNTWVKFFDAPSLPLKSNEIAWDNETFDTFLMFRPTGGIWVPLRRTTWQLHMSATAQWTPSSSAPYITLEADNPDFPLWDSIYNP